MANRILNQNILYSIFRDGSTLLSTMDALLAGADKQTVKDIKEQAD